MEPVKHCMDIPKEVCAKSRINPVRKKRPVVRKWCGPAPQNPGDTQDRQVVVCRTNVIPNETFGGNVWSFNCA